MLQGINNYCQTTWAWTKENPVKAAAVTIVATLTLSVLVGQIGILTNSPNLIKSSKFATIICPLAYTATFPFVTLLYAFAVGGHFSTRYDRDQTMATLNSLYSNYIQSIGKVWIIWGEFVAAS